MNVQKSQAYEVTWYNQVSDQTVITKLEDWTPKASTPGIVKRQIGDTELPIASTETKTEYVFLRESRALRLKPTKGQLVLKPERIVLLDIINKTAYKECVLETYKKGKLKIHVPSMEMEPNFKLRFSLEIQCANNEKWYCSELFIGEKNLFEKDQVPKNLQQTTIKQVKLPAVPPASKPEQKALETPSSPSWNIIKIPSTASKYETVSNNDINGTSAQSQSPCDSKRDSRLDNSLPKKRLKVSFNQTAQVPPTTASSTTTTQSNSMMES